MDAKVKENAKERNERLTRCQRTDCFACKDKHCVALTEAFPEYRCPFFKTVEKYNEDREKARILNDLHGMGIGYVR